MESLKQITFSTDFINNLIDTYHTTSFEDFQRKIPTNTKIQLLKEMGYVGQNILKTLIKIHTTDIQQKIKSKHFLQLLQENFDISHVQQDNITWLSNLFSSNDIQPSTFFTEFITIHSMNIPKIITFVLQ